MDRLRQLLLYIRTQLSVLNTSQRVAIGLCAALVVGSVLWLLQWSTTSSMVPAVSYEFSFEELDAAEGAMQAGGIPYRIQGTRLYVRPADRHNVVRLLYTAEALPAGSLFDMEAMVTDDNPFQSPAARSYAQNYAKGNELAKIIATYPSVRNASVLINPRTKRRIGGPSDVPTASVTVTLVPAKEMTFEMVEAFAKLISGAVAGLKPHNVTVVDGRSIRSYSVPRPEEAATVGHWRIVQKLEERLLGKIRTKLAGIPGMRATVTVELDSSKRIKQTSIHDPPQPRLEFQHSTEVASAAQPVEPGTQANIGQAVTAGPTGQRNTTEESNVENFEPRLRETETVEQGPTIKRVTAAVSIPRSFVVGVFRAKHPETPEPKDDDPAFVAVVDQELTRVRESVETIVMAKSPDDVQVDMYPDVEWGEGGPVWSASPAAVAMAQGGARSDSAFDLIRGYGPQVGLTLLALISLFMMLRVVRKSAQLVSTVTHPPKPEEDAGEEQILAVGAEAVGQAAASGTMLVGKEVEDDALRHVELRSEVSKLVREDPKGAADMINRWMSPPE